MNFLRRLQYERPLLFWVLTFVAFGAWLMVPSTVSAELVGAAGFDYVCVDCQHGLVDYTALVPMLQAMSRFDVTAVVRDVDWKLLPSETLRVSEPASR